MFKFKKELKDIGLMQTSKGYDLKIENNSFVEEASSFSPIINAITETKRQEYELNADFPLLKRGGSYFYDSIRGSLLWLKERLTDSSKDISEYQTYILKSLEWLKIDGFVDSVTISRLLISNETAFIDILLTVNSKSENINIII
jgi:phage gp46-like protein